MNSTRVGFKMGPLDNPMHRLLKEGEDFLVLFSILCYGAGDV